MEIGTAFHQHEDDIDHIAVRNNGVAFYMAKIADNPRERADLAMANVVRNQILESPSQLNIPASGTIPVAMCLDNSFSIDLEMRNSHVMYRMVKPSRQQSDYGPREWYTESWSMSGFSVAKGETCELLNESGQGYKVVITFQSKMMNPDIYITRQWCLHLEELRRLNIHQTLNTMR